jgi:hypothetical protein
MNFSIQYPTNSPDAWAFVNFDGSRPMGQSMKNIPSIEKRKMQRRKKKR